MAAEDQREELAACLKKLHLPLRRRCLYLRWRNWRAAAREKAKLMNFARIESSVRSGILAFETPFWVCQNVGCMLPRDRA